MYHVAAFYKFADFPDYAEHQEALRACGEAHGVVGSILLAREGVNGTIGGDRDGVETVLTAIRAIPGFADMEHKESEAHVAPFRRMKVRLKKEIVTMGRADVDAANDAGVYVAPEDWNDLIAREDVALIDARNDYEVEIGAFEGAINPKTEAFGEFPEWLSQFRQETGAKTLAMYCTGGIRCEKATAYAKAIGFEEVYHLKGGILKYLEKTPEEESRWQGECYVFDERVSLVHGLKQGDQVICRACGFPVDAEGRKSIHYVEGVSCARCYDQYSDHKKAKFAARHKRMTEGVSDPFSDKD